MSTCPPHRRPLRTRRRNGYLQGRDRRRHHSDDLPRRNKVLGRVVKGRRAIQPAFPDHTARGREAVPARSVSRLWRLGQRRRAVAAIRSRPAMATALRRRATQQAHIYAATPRHEGDRQEDESGRQNKPKRGGRRPQGRRDAEIRLSWWMESSWNDEGVCDHVGGGQRRRPEGTVKHKRFVMPTLVRPPSGPLATPTLAGKTCRLGRVHPCAAGSSSHDPAIGRGCFHGRRKG